MANEMSSALRALADPTRLEIVEFLAACCCARAEVDDEGGVISPTAGEVCCRITGESRINSTISHHLQELEAAGLITRRRLGKRTLCALNPSALDRLGDYLKSLAKGETQNAC